MSYLLLQHKQVWQFVVGFSSVFGPFDVMCTRVKNPASQSYAEAHGTSERNAAVLDKFKAARNSKNKPLRRKCNKYHF